MIDDVQMSDRGILAESRAIPLFAIGGVVK